MTSNPNWRGQPGEPGAPGEPGRGGGGAGGAGGHGGRGGTADRRLLILGAFFVMIAIGLSVGTLVLLRDVNSNNNKIAILEARDRAEFRVAEMGLQKVNDRQDMEIKRDREADYRLCLRQQVTRALFILDERAEHHADLTKGIRLYDCRPDLHGQHAKPLGPRQARQFLHYVYTARNLP